MKSPCLRISLNDCRLSTLKWWWRMYWFSSSNWWQACYPHSFCWLKINCSQTDFLQKPFLYQLFLLQPFSRDFQSPPPLQIFLLGWHELRLATAVAGVEKEKEFNIPSQFLKYADPLLEIVTFLQSVLVFLLSGHLEVDLRRIIFLPACEHMVIFLVEPELVSPWKRLFSFAYLQLCLSFQLKFQLFCLLLCL